MTQEGVLGMNVHTQDLVGKIPIRRKRQENKQGSATEEALIG